MAYSKFSLKAVKEQLGVQVIEDVRLFDPAQLPKVTASDYLQTTLAEFAPLALSINTEKSRSEWIIAPVLAEVRRRYQNRISLFSGTTFNVDETRGLDGQCDYILSLNPEQLYVVAPVVTIVEAKKEDIIGGVGQCISTMYAAQLFNEREQLSLPCVYGAVTTGSTWKFMKLQGQTAYIDLDEYYLNEIETLLGIFSSIISPEEQSVTTK